MPASAPRIILASTSPYRRDLLGRLRLPFEVVPSHVDETPWPEEAPAALAVRLALAKARAVAAQHPDAWVIGSDQVCDLAGQVLNKPGTHDRAVAQLRALSGQRAQFHTALALVRADPAHIGQHLSTVNVRYRPLDEAEIHAYLMLDQPYDCAGSAKCETLGISLVEHIHSDDPTALVGLPLIATTRLLRQAGVDVLGLAAARSHG